MSGFGNTLKGQVLNHLFDKAPWAPPATLWVALSTANPTDAGTGLAEPGDTYQRVATNAADWASAVVGASAVTLKNATEIAFPLATAGWGTVGYFALMSAGSGGNLLVHGVLSSPVSVLANYELKFPVGMLTAQLD